MKPTYHAFALTKYITKFNPRFQLIRCKSGLKKQVYLTTRFFYQTYCSLLHYGPFTPAIFSTIAWTCTICVILGCTVLNDTIHTCDFSNYCVNLKVKEWVVYPFLRDFLRDFCALYWVGNKFSCFVDIFCTLLFM